MKIRNLIFCLILLHSIPSFALPVDLGGVGAYVESQSSAFIAGKLDDELALGVSAAFEIWRNRNFQMPNYDTRYLKDEIHKELFRRFERILPDLVEQTLKERVFQQAFGKEDLEEIMKLKSEVEARLKQSWGGLIDEAANRAYQEVASRIANPIEAQGINPYNLRETVTRWVSSANLSQYLGGVFAREFGDQTVNAIRSRLETAFRGDLPPELVNYLEMGPEYIADFKDKVGQYLPGRILGKYEAWLFNKPFIRMPTAAYAAILAARAAEHFARAYSSMVVDLEALEQGIRVTRVMIMQVKNKKWIGISIRDLASLGSELADAYNFRASFDKLSAEIQKPLAKIEELAGRIDSLVMKPLNFVDEQCRGIVDELTAELKKIQSYVADPLEEYFTAMGDGLDLAGQTIASKIPDELNGMPRDWRDLRDRYGIDYGDWSDQRPIDLLNDLGEKTGISQVLENVGEKIGELNSGIADAAATTGSNALESVGLLPVAYIWLMREPPPELRVEKSAFDPVLLHSGEFIICETDLCLASPQGSIPFRRCYRSRQSDGVLGAGWSHIYERRLYKIAGGDVVYLDSEMNAHVFVKEKDSFKSSTSKDYLLKKNSSGYVLAYNGCRMQFGSGGRIEKERGACGAKEFIYEGDKLKSVMAKKRTLNFYYDDKGRLSSLKDQSGRRISFEYDGRGLLSRVTRPVGMGRDSRLYGYDEARRLSAILADDGGLVVENTYDANGRVVLQKMPKGNVRAKYGKGWTWVWDEKNILRIYGYDPDGRFASRWVWKDKRWELEERATNQTGNIAHDDFELKLDSDGRILSSSSSGANWDFKYSEDGQLLGIKGDARSILLERNLNSDVQAVVAESGERFGLKYLAPGKLDRPETFSFPGASGEFRSGFCNICGCDAWVGEIVAGASIMRFTQSGFPIKSGQGNVCW